LVHENEDDRRRGAAVIKNVAKVLGGDTVLICRTLNRLQNSGISCKWGKKVSDPRRRWGGGEKEDEQRGPERKKVNCRESCVGKTGRERTPKKEKKRQEKEGP